MFTLLEFESTDSTSSLLKEHYASFPNFTVIRTDFQTNGRGQFDRKWDAKPRQNLLMSILLKNISIHLIDLLKKQTIGILQGVLAEFGIQTRFKAPNDIYVNEDKICGILIETKTGESELDYVVIGIGLNVNQETFGDYPATSMSKVLHKKMDVMVVFYNVITAFEKYLLKGV